MLEAENLRLCAKLAAQAKELAKLNIILYHRENGLSHPDFNAEIEISKQAEEIGRLKELIRYATGGIEVFVKDIEAVKQTLEQALKGEQEQ